MILLVFSSLSGSEESPEEGLIGFEELDDGKVWHIWNTNDDYFFNSSSGIQFSNHYQEYWTHNIFCGGYKDGEGNWHYDCNDALPFTWSYETDNLTYVNITGWREKTISGKTVRLAIRYHLEVNDTRLTIIPYIKNIGSSDINVDLGFAWRVDRIRIGMDVENDFIYINDTEYQLSESLDLTFKNMTKKMTNITWNNTCIYECNQTYEYESEEWYDCVDLCKIIDYYYVPIPSYKMFDRHFNKYLTLNWNKNLKYAVQVKSSQQYNAPTTLGINVGTLAIGQEKSTEFYWIDAAPTQLWYDGFEAAGWADNYTETGWITDEGTVQKGSQSIEASGETNEKCTLTYAFDLTSYDYCNITAGLYIEEDVDAGEEICLDYSNDNGTTWNRNSGGDDGVGGLCQDANIDTEDTWRTVRYDISDTTGIKNFTVRFRMTSSGVTERGFADELNITCYAPLIYNLTIKDPTTASPESVTAGDEITITFNYTESDIPLTTGVTVENVTIGTKNATILDRFCTGTLDCTQYTTQASCENCSECTWGVYLYNETFEDESFPPTGWSTGGNANWFRDTTHVNTGTASAGSGNINDNQKSWLNYSMTFQNDGNVSFDWNVSSEKDYDYLCFCVDKNCGDSGCQCEDGGQADASIDSSSDGVWTSGSVVHQVSAGTYTFFWCYAKDGSTSKGDDMGIVDNITFNDYSSACSNEGGCSACDIGECDTNCSDAGCSKTHINYTASGWIVNITVPSGLSGSQNLFLMANYSNNLRNETQTNAISYATADTCTPGAADWIIQDTCIKTADIDHSSYNIVIDQGGRLIIENNAVITAKHWNITKNATTHNKLNITPGARFNVTG